MSLVYVILGFIINTLSWWSALKISDRHNSKNSLKSASGFAFLITLLATFVASLGGLGPFSLIALVLWLVAVVRIYCDYYGLGLFHSLVTLVLFVVSNLVMAFAAGAIGELLGLA